MENQKTIGRADAADAADAKKPGFPNDATAEQIRPAAHLSSWLTAEELAKEFQCSVKTIYKWADAGLIPSKRIGGKLLRFNRAVLSGEWSNGCTAKRSKHDGSIQR